MVRRDRRETPAADHGDARRSASTRRRVSASSARRDELLLARPHLQRERALARLGQQLGRLEAAADLAGEPEPIEPARSEHDGVEPALAALAQARVDVAAQRLDRRAPARARAAARAAAPTPCRSASPAEASTAPQSASRGSSRARYAPTDEPVVSVEVMSLAEWTATSIRPSSSASSSSFTKTPRAPISPNGLVRSRSPAVVIGTSAISTPGPPQPLGGQLGLRQREPTAARTDAGQHVTAPLAEPEQMADARRAYAGPVGAGRRLLHPHRRHVQQLVDDLRRHRLDRPALRLGQPPSRFARARARPRRISSARARSDAIAGTTSSDACHARNRSASVGDDRLGPSRLAPPAGEALGDDASRSSMS